MNLATKNLNAVGRSGLPGEALVEASDLVFAAGGQNLLENISLSLQPREIVTVIGPNGAGKTTLVKVLLGILTPVSGTVSRRPGIKIGYVPQKFVADGLVPLTVARLITLTQKASPKQIDAVLRETGVEHLKDREISALSGGELQRALLARALVNNPDLLVLDEPVQGVDFAGEIKLYDLISKIRDVRGCGILMVSHDLHVVMAESDRVICLNRHICCEGRPEAVQHHPEYARLFGAAAKAVGVYRHAHDHDHDVSGAVTPVTHEPNESGHSHG